MSKVTIKFWDIIKSEYRDDPRGELLMNNFHEVFEDYTWGQEQARELEPHFYKDGERIA